MIFSLCNAGSTFQRFINKIFENIIKKFVVVYINVILTTFNYFSEHLKHLNIVFQRITQTGLKVKFGKC